MKLPRLYPIADIGTLRARGMDLGDFTRALVAGGAGIIQLRSKDQAPQEILRQAEVMSEAAAGTECLLVMNDRPDLALLAGWRAVHVGHNDLPPEAARVVFGAGESIVGVSTHNGAQVAAADAGSADYVAIGPVFGTSTKADAEAVVGLEGVRLARSQTRKPLVAIGGITLETAAAVIEAGADSVAVIGGLFQGGKRVDDVVRDFFRLLR